MSPTTSQHRCRVEREICSTARIRARGSSFTAASKSWNWWGGSTRWTTSSTAGTGWTRGGSGCRHAYNAKGAKIFWGEINSTYGMSVCRISSAENVVTRGGEGGLISTGPGENRCNVQPGLLEKAPQDRRASISALRSPLTMSLWAIMAESRAVDLGGETCRPS
ncbi:unnamed protein product [Scytosiphon promiscuus]